MTLNHSLPVAAFCGVVVLSVLPHLRAIGSAALVKSKSQP